MKFNFTMKNSFFVNGKEYGSVEEMPREIREAYERAMRASQGQGHIGKDGGSIPVSQGKPIVPGSSLSRQGLVSITAILLLLGVAYLLLVSGR